MPYLSYEWGYGAATDLAVGSGTTPTVGEGGDAFYDWGYGSANDYAGGLDSDSSDTGYGSPFLDGFGGVLKVGPLGQWPDEGGELVVVAAISWPDGPIFVKLEDTGTGTQYPLTEYCYSSKPGDKYEVYPNGSKDELQFAMPPVKPGTYDIVFKHGSNLNGTIIADNAIEVIRRNRSAETSRVRANFPPHYKTGPRQIKNELDLTPYPDIGPTGASEEFPMDPLACLLHAMGQSSQLLHGTLVTRLTTTLGTQDTTAYVESTLAFPDEGTVFVGGWKYTYTGKTDNTLTGLAVDESKSADVVARLLNIVAGTEVHLDPRSILPK